MIMMSVYKDMAHDAEIPDPIELMESRIERNCDRVTEVDGVLIAPCGNCDERVPLDDLTCMTPTGDDPGLCPDCFEEWGKQKKRSND